MIDPNVVTTARVGELSSAPFELTDKIPHEIEETLFQGTVLQLADLIGDYLGTSSSLAFNPTTVVDGGTLPATDSNEWMLVGKGTFHNVGGGSDITTTEELNAVTSNGTYWSLAVEIPVNVELAGITQNIRSGYTTTTPSENTVYNALALKLNSGGYSGTAQDIINLINSSTAIKEPQSFTAVSTGINQTFTITGGYQAKTVYKSKGLLYKTSEWTQSGSALTIIPNTNTGNTIYVEF